MKRLLRAVGAAGLLLAGSIAVVATAGPARADTQICDQYGSTTVANRYVVMNNNWGDSTTQCINVTNSGFSITTASHNKPTNGAPGAYPAIYYGCHYTNCSPGTNLPLQVSQISSATSSISFSYPSSGTYDAAYDIWLDPTPKKDGVNQQEIMIWFNRQGSIQPVGSRTGSATIGGRTWEVWTGSNGSNNVVSYVAPSPITSWSFSVLDFINDTKTRSNVTNSWYLTSIQAGFEPWVGGVGLAVNSFSATVNGGGGGGSTPPPSTTPPPSGGGACRVTYTTNSWNNGFTADVSVTNTSSSAVNGWRLTFSFPGNQQVTSAWNATVAQSGSAVTATNAGYNASIAPNGSVSFGFQGTYSGTNSAPSNFALNGTACTRA
ncbi:GH12 family glycosyl hydrolase domain-containing protein [Planosporangium mesophilum]|uniref:Glycosyl hydrolase family 5 n=1 Tax=Planosporangium mesophilum TaxID=689768 RepID=A0A8J3X2B3_9ACTN|nr:cellulose binding domain-containing protein [Planosporangium mesophilum]NJC81956.1 glycosyl hydrolase family 5 [Planosporangium mesophilum]GII25280.1 glycosyl hydrolase family 5 [Planosporangium mesophilum]